MAARILGDDSEIIAVYLEHYGEWFLVQYPEDGKLNCAINSDEANFAVDPFRFLASFKSPPVVNFNEIASLSIKGSKVTLTMKDNSVEEFCLEPNETIQTLRSDQLRPIPTRSPDLRVGQKIADALINALSAPDIWALHGERWADQLASSNLSEVIAPLADISTVDQLKPNSRYIELKVGKETIKLQAGLAVPEEAIYEAWDRCGPNVEATQTVDSLGTTTRSAGSVSAFISRVKSEQVCVIVGEDSQCIIPPTKVLELLEQLTGQPYDPKANEPIREIDLYQSEGKIILVGSETHWDLPLKGPIEVVNSLPEIDVDFSRGNW